jgi:hypothetical protein
MSGSPDGFAVHAVIVGPSALVPDDLAANDPRVGGAYAAFDRLPVVEPTTLQQA